MYHDYQYMNDDSKSYVPYTGNEELTFLYSNSTDTDSITFKGQGEKQDFYVNKAGGTDCIFYEYVEYLEYHFKTPEHQFLIRNNRGGLEIYFDEFEKPLPFSAISSEINHRTIKYYDTININSVIFKDVYLFKDFNINNDTNSAFLYYSKKDGILKYLNFFSKERFSIIQ